MYKVFLGDALDLIREIESESMDLIFCDYPFRMKPESNKVLANEFWRILKDTGNLILINNPTNFFRIIPYYQKFIFRNELILIRPYKFIPFGKRMFYFKHNSVIWLVKSKNYYFKDHGINDVLDIHYKVKGKNIGSLPKELVEILIKSLTKKGDTVLDVFAGLGTVLKVCKELKRNYIGFEIKKELYEQLLKIVST